MLASDTGCLRGVVIVSESVMVPDVVLSKNATVRSSTQGRHTCLTTQAVLIRRSPNKHLTAVTQKETNEELC